MNISSTGMLLLPAASAHVGLPMCVTFEVKDFLGSLELEAVLAREADYRGHYAWGVRFVETPRRVDTLLQLYVKKRLLAAQSQHRTPPPGSPPLERTDSGLYHQAKRRSSLLTPSSPNSRVLEATPDAALPSEFEEAHTERDPTGGFVALDATPWPMELTVEPQTQRLRHSPQRSDDERVQSSGTYRHTPPPMAGIGAPGGIPRRKSKASTAPQRPAGSWARSAKRGHSTEDPRMSRTGPPRRGAVEVMHSTGPRHEAVQQKQRRQAAAAKGEWSRDSHETPIEVRELYQAALEEVVDGGKKKKKRKK